MTWLELANFINNEMPECNKNEQATVWDGGDTGRWYPIHSITPIDMCEESSKDNYYSVDINATDDYWD